MAVFLRYVLDFIPTLTPYYKLLPPLVDCIALSFEINTANYLGFIKLFLATHLTGQALAFTKIYGYTFLLLKAEGTSRYASCLSLFVIYRVAIRSPQLGQNIARWKFCSVTGRK